MNSVKSDLKNSRKNEISVNKNLSTIFKSSLLFYVAGLFIDILFYLYNEKYLLSAINGTTILLLLLLLVFHSRKKISNNSILLLEIGFLLINFYISIFIEAAFSYPNADKMVIIVALLCLLPLFLSAFTIYRYASMIIAISTILVYGTASFIMEDNFMLQVFPILALLFLGTSLIISYLNILRRIEFDNIRLLIKQREIIRYCELEYKEWRELKNNKITKEELLRIFDRMEKSVKEHMIEHAKDLIHKEDRIGDILKSRYPDLTATEIQLCYYIIQGKTVGEICDFRNVSPSTITSMRSRLRTKMDLQKNDNLQQYLKKMVYEKDI